MQGELVKQKGLANSMLLNIYFFSSYHMICILDHLLLLYFQFKRPWLSSTPCVRSTQSKQEYTSSTGESPISKLSTKKLVTRNNPCLIQLSKFLFFGGKLLLRQNVPATKRLGKKRSGRQNVDTRKLKIHVKKIQPHTTKKTFQNIFFAT